MTDVWPFEDADEFPDAMWWLIERGRADTPAIGHFVRVMWFHGDFLNGGLNQVMYNLKVAAGEAVEDYARSFELMGMSPLATVIRLADKAVWTGETSESVFGREPAELDAVYNAIAFGLASEGGDQLAELRPRAANGEERLVDQVSRAALKFARDHHGEFAAFIAGYRQELDASAAREREE